MFRFFYSSDGYVEIYYFSLYTICVYFFSFKKAKKIMSNVMDSVKFRDCKCEIASIHRGDTQAQCSSVTNSCPMIGDPWTAAGQASLSFTLSRSLPKFIFTELVMPSNHLILCHLTLLLPSIFPSIRVFIHIGTACL